MKRKIYNELLSWKKRSGKSALLIQGARRVGKSYIAEEFAKNECELLMTEVTSFVLSYQTRGGHTPTIPCYGNYFMVSSLCTCQQKLDTKIKN